MPVFTISGLDVGLAEYWKIGTKIGNYPYLKINEGEKQEGNYVQTNGSYRRQCQEYGKGD